MPTVGGSLGASQENRRKQSKVTQNRLAAKKPSGTSYVINQLSRLNTYERQSNFQLLICGWASAIQTVMHVLIQLLWYYLRREPMHESWPSSSWFL